MIYKPSHPMISYWLFSVAPFLIGLGLGDSPLVILSLCSLAPFFIISIFSLFFYHLFLYFLPLPYVFLHEVVFLNIHLYYLSKKCFKYSFVIHLNCFKTVDESLLNYLLQRVSVICCRKW